MKEIQLSDPQTENFLDENAFPLFVAGMGAGKSTTMVAKILRDCLEFPGARIGAYAPTYDLLTLITVAYLEAFLTEASISYVFNQSRMTFKLPRGSEIICRSMDNPARVVGYETFRSHCDELDTLPADKAEAFWNKVIARNRQKITVDGVMQRNQVSAYTTPEGFQFCYKRWVKLCKAGYSITRAPTYSNPHLPEGYIDSMRETYPAELIDAYIEGEFVNLTSGKVYTSYDRLANDSDAVIRENEPLIVGMDFNVMRGCAVIFVQRGEDWHAAAEIYNATDTPEQIAILQKRYPLNPITVYPDATGDNRKSVNVTKTDIKLLKEARFRVVHNPSNPPIKARVMSVNARLCDAKKVRRVFVNTTNCPNLTESLEQQVYSKEGTPAKGEGKFDDLNDAFGYPIAYEFGIYKPTANRVAVIGRY